MKNSGLKRIRSFFIFLIPVILFSYCEETEKITDPIDPGQTQLGEQIWAWETPVGESITASPAIGDDGTIYVVTGGGNFSLDPARVFAVNRDGTTRWFTDPLDHNAGSSDVAIGPDGTIFAIGSSTLYAIDPYTGLFKWTWEPPEPHRYKIGYLALGEDNTVFCSNIDTGSYPRAIFAVKHGYIQWKVSRNSDHGAKHLMVSRNSQLKLFWRNEESGNYHVESFNPTSGSLNWSTEIDEGQVKTLQDYGNGTLLAVTSSPEKVYWIDGLTGTFIQEKDIAANQISIGADGNFYTFVPNTGLTAYNGSGDVLWSVDNGWSGHSGVALTEDNKVLVFGFPSEKFANGNFQCFSNSGEFLWSKLTGDSYSFNAPLITPNGKIFVYEGSRPGTLICLKGDQGLANTGWPRPQHDNKNTRNTNLW
jgi:hypothetical protein